MAAELPVNKAPSEDSLTAPGSQADKFQDLLERLADSNVYERQRAAIALGTTQDPRAVKPLLAALRDPDIFVRNFAARSLGNLKDVQAVEPLIRTLQDGNLLVRRSSIEALGSIGNTKAVEPLIGKIKTGSDIERRAAIEALGRIGDPAAIKVLIDALHDQDVYVRNGAVDALSKMGETALPHLIPELSDWTVGPAILDILRDHNWKPSSTEEKIWFDIASRNRKSLLENWSTASKILFERAENGNDRQIQNAVLALIGIGQEDAVDRLVKIIDEKGTVKMAEAFLNSGNNTLEEAARRWASQNDSEVSSGDNASSVQWGSMGTS